MGVCCSCRPGAFRNLRDREQIELPGSNVVGRYTDPPPRVPSPRASGVALDPERRMLQETTVAPVGGLNYGSHRRRSPPEHGATEARSPMPAVPGNPTITPRSHHRARFTSGSNADAHIGLGLQIGESGSHAPPPYSGPSSTVRRVHSPSLEHDFHFDLPPPQERVNNDEPTAETGLMHISATENEPRASFMEPAPDTPTPAQRKPPTLQPANDRSRLPSELRRNGVIEQTMELDVQAEQRTLQQSSSSQRRLPTPSNSPRPVSDGILLGTPRRTASATFQGSFRRK